MGNFLSKLTNFIGIEEEDDMMDNYDDDYGYEEEDLYEEPAPIKESRSRSKKNTGNVVTLPNAAMMKMVLFNPLNIEDTQSIVESIKSHKPVVMNLEELLETPESEADAVRIVDFVNGAIYALNGSIRRVSKGIFIVAPSNCDVISNDDDYRRR